MSQIDDLCAAIRARPADPWDWDTMAAFTHYSRWHFARVFRRRIGVTPGRFVAQVRLEAARRLLASGQPLRIADVCTQVGYSSLGSFISTFGARYGLPPGLYRRRHASGTDPATTTTAPERTPAS